MTLKLNGTAGIEFPDGSTQKRAFSDTVGTLVVVVGANPKPGSLPLSGQTIARADYPELVDWARYESGMVATSGTDKTNNPDKWYSADGWVTCVLPNFNGSGDFIRPLQSGVTAGARVMSQNKVHNHGIVLVGAPSSGLGTGIVVTSTGAPQGTSGTYTAQEGGAEAYPNHTGLLHCVWAR